jgi:hypothetical protein
VSTDQVAVAESAANHVEAEREFPFIVDNKEYFSRAARLTGAEIMQRAGIPSEAGLIEIGPDGTQHPVQPDQVIDLNRPHRFRHPPRFARG